MPSKEEKQRRSKLLKHIQNKEKEKFEDSLPINRNEFTKLFDFLDEKLGEVECDNTLQLTEQYFMHINNITEIDKIKKWLQEHGGYCDCEVLANVEEKFE
jgi:hypothetical protein